MNKWRSAAKARLIEIQTAVDGAKDMQAMAAAFAKLPKGQLKKVLTEEIVAVLEKYRVAIDEN